MTAFDLSRFPIHLGMGATAVREPEFTGDMQWYQGYIERHETDGSDARLVGLHEFSSSWDSWEVHPNGHEVVIVTAGAMVLIQEIEGAEVRTELSAGMAAINPPGVWHTADVDGPVTALFITAGLGTEHRPRRTPGSR